jgi:hypothetical protein
MSTYNPDRWLLVKLTTDGKSHYRVFATWVGGYTTGDSWKLNSGITKATFDGDYYHFEGSSGSVYICHKRGYGTTIYGQSVIDNLIDQSEETAIEILSESIDPLALRYE